MPYEWDPNLMQYSWTTDEGAGSALLPGMAPDLSMQEAYGIAAESMLPGYRDIPGAGRFLGRARAPLFGQYLMGYNPAVTAAQQPTFQGWLSGAQGSPTAGIGNVWQNFPGPGTPGVNPWGSYSGDDWSNVVNLARNMGYGTSPAQPISGMPGFGTYGEMLKEPEMASALTSMATYDPRAGSIYGGLRQAGLNRAYQDWAATRPAVETTASDWLGYISGQQGMVTPEFYRPPV